MRFFKLTVLLSFFTCFATAQVRTLQAVKVNQSIRIDGALDDAAWKNVPVATDFIVSFPKFGDKPTRHTEVKIVYDNTAVYIGAYLYDDPSNIRKQLTGRDVLDLQDADVFTIGLDTYQDRQNAFMFQVSAAGVQGDARQSPTSGFDRSWDAVWESRTSIKADGWVAEIKIPFSAIRFAKKNLQDWGLQFTRYTRKDNENSTWSPEDPNVSGTVNKWGNFTGLQNITPPLRLSFLPYLSSGVRVSPTSHGSVTEYLKSGGMDVKYGINESFTLDVTLIPDFAQVQSDNVFLNLSPFEVKFDDYRPFFTEGTELFNKAGLFYSRRIGAQPDGTGAVLDFVSSNPKYTIKKNPGITRLYNATKFSGRTSHNLGIGVLNAVTVPMYAKLHNEITGKDSSILTEPLANYNIIVFDQVLKNRSSVSITNTNVMRKGNSRNANVTGVNVSLYDKKNVHNFRINTNYSSIWGKGGSYNGFTTYGNFAKVSGKLQYEIGSNVESDRYDPNDLGYLQNPNGFGYYGYVGYIINKANKHFLNQRYSLNVQNSYLYKPFAWTEFSLNGNAFVLFKNFWDLSVNFSAHPIWYNDFFEARTPGQNLRRVPYAFVGINGSTDSRKKLYVGWNIGGAESPIPDDPFYTVNMSVRYRFSDKFQVSLSSGKDHDKGGWGYRYRDSTGRPIIGFRDTKTNTNVLHMQYNFTPRMNWTVRMRHIWSHVHYINFYTLRPSGDWDMIAFTPGYDNNFNAFNIDMFYTWDFKWGSRLTLAWKNGLGNDVYLDPYTFPTYRKNFGNIFNNPHSNELSLKIVYYLDYLSLKKK